MHVAYVSNYGYSVGLALRLKNEGHDVMFWCDPGTEKDSSVGRLKLCGKGLVPVTHSWAYLLAWAKEHALRSPTIMVFEGSRMGDKADAARRAGIHVIGSGKFCDRLEADRLFGFKIAEEAGCSLPPYEDFKTISDAIAFARTLGDTATFWKTDKYLESDATRGTRNGEELVAYLEGVRRNFGENIPSIIQQKIEGVALSTARWWNGRAWTGRFEGDIEHKKAFNDELGPSTGCSFDAVWFYESDTPPIASALGWEMIGKVFAQQEAPPGVYDINAVCDAEGRAHFLEWTPRFGWDSTPTSFALLKSELGQFFWGLATGTADGPDMSSDIAYSIRLGVPPYPWEHWCPPQDKFRFTPPAAYGIELDDPMFLGYQLAQDDEAGLVVASPDGLLGLALDTGRALSAIDERVRDWIDEHKSGVSGMVARTDGAKRIKSDAAALNATDLRVPDGLLR